MQKELLDIPQPLLASDVTLIVTKALMKETHPSSVMIENIYLYLYEVLGRYTKVA
jgi:hypothetical protein